MTVDGLMERGFKTEDYHSGPDAHAGSGSILNPAKAKKQIHTCLYCGYSNHKLNNVSEHVNIHHKKLALQCTECSYTTLRNQCLSLHRLKKHNLGAMRCPLCKFRSDLQLNFVSVSILLKIIINLPGGQIIDPSLGETLCSFVPPNSSLVSVSDP